MISIVIISKNEPALDETLSAVCHQAECLGTPCEVVVVDASNGALDHVRARHETRVRWVQFHPPTAGRTTIPHQRNVGVQESHGEIIVFTDAGCIPEAGWLFQLVDPLSKGEEYVTYGLTLGTPGGTRLHDRVALQRIEKPYLLECSTINTAFRREVYEAVGGFDESFAYGSDVDFSWRFVAAGYRIRNVPNAVIRHDWGTWKRQARRSYLYGKARTRLYHKHPKRLRRIIQDDPMVIAYALFIVGLPLTVLFPFYPALLLIPAWRNRADGVLNVVVDHLIFGAGVLTELTKI